MASLRSSAWGARSRARRPCSADLSSRRSCLLLGGDLFQVTDVGPRSEVVEHPVGAPPGEQLADPAAGVGEIAEHDGARRAGLLAGGRDVAVRQRAALQQRLVLAE